MSQKSSVPQAISFVSQVLKRDTVAIVFAAMLPDSLNDLTITKRNLKNSGGRLTVSQWFISSLGRMTTRRLPLLVNLAQTIVNAAFFADGAGRFIKFAVSPAPLSCARGR
jgi:hypothetical protein